MDAGSDHFFSWVTVFSLEGGGGGGGTPNNGLYGEAPTEGVPFSRLQVHESVGISLVTVYENVGKFMASASAAVKRDVNF